MGHGLTVVANALRIGEAIEVGVGVNGFGTMSAEAEKISRPGFLSDIYIPKNYVPNLSDSNHVFRTAARDIGCVSQRTVLCGPA